VLENGDEEHGTSVHFVTDELDGGPVILQAKVPVFAGDSEEEITARVQAQEHAIYPLVISWFVDGRLRMAGNHAWLDERQLPRRAMPPTNEQPAPRAHRGAFFN
jgi:phosphoribosylglycinamide formyltransferase-1